ncbi:hypothetical protein GWK48_05915 [Metallosphaera tengchongensis]|uniref:Uncharacterized protein n=1 Tax=Metallosphaera tengchongensis TaxID=1532350 RepID=A0A6N0NUY8_9CREN|nr:hypothetical protein [Metallosphaera tengchongensis]QKQ99976.1 hypothetical protein GWK48_05915 [Metallosphaera tengchongensis]
MTFVIKVNTAGDSVFVFKWGVGRLVPSLPEQRVGNASLTCDIESR